MQPYNVEIFGTDFQLKHHYNSGKIDFKYDYLSPAENTIVIARDQNIQKGDYIRIVNDREEYFGIIKGITETGNTTSQIRYAPFETKFNSMVMFDTDLQCSDISLEQMIADYISEYWINNADELQNIMGLSVETISETNGWGFHLTSDVKDLHKTIINFMSVIIKRSMTKYQVGLYIEPDFDKKEIIVKIGKKAENIFHIEADLPNIVKKSIVLNETTQDMNKLIIYNSKDLEENLIFYKHPDKTYSTVDEDRITPVIYEIQSAALGEDQTFEEAAEIVAARTFDQESYSNLIELTVLNEDDVVNAREISIGQEVMVISNGTMYSSILTGYEIGKLTKLIFGTIRLDLTKILKGASK